MEDVETIRTLLADRRLAVVARATGVSRETLWRIREKRVMPHNDTLRKIAAYFEAQHAAHTR